MPTVTSLVAHAPLDTVHPLVEQAAAAAGWRVTTTPGAPATPGRAGDGAGGGTSEGLTLRLTRGDKWRTRLLGAAAGDDFYLAQTITLTPTTDASQAAAALSLLGGSGATAQPGSQQPGQMAAGGAGMATVAGGPAAAGAGPATGMGRPEAGPTPGATSASTSGATLLTYPTSGAGAIGRGGVFGADQEMRAHELTSQLLLSTLRAAGLTVGHA